MATFCQAEPRLPASKNEFLECPAVLLNHPTDDTKISLETEADTHCLRFVSVYTYGKQLKEHVLVVPLNNIIQLEHSTTLNPRTGKSQTIYAVTFEQSDEHLAHRKLQAGALKKLAIAVKTGSTVKSTWTTWARKGLQYGIKWLISTSVIESNNTPQYQLPKPPTVSTSSKPAISDPRLSTFLVRFTAVPSSYEVASPQTPTRVMKSTDKDDDITSDSSSKCSFVSQCSSLANGGYKLNHLMAHVQFRLQERNELIDEDLCVDGRWHSREGSESSSTHLPFDSVPVGSPLSAKGSNSVFDSEKR